MSRHRLAQDAERAEVPPTRESSADQQRAQVVGAWPLDEPFPALLTDADLRRVLDVSWATFYRLKKLQRFKVLIAAPVLTTTVRYSGFKVRAWVDGAGLPGVRGVFGGTRRAEQRVAAISHVDESADVARFRKPGSAAK